MACKQWNESWVAHLYGELEPEQERRLTAHLASCEDCRGTMEKLADSRSLLREATPQIPFSPRVVVLQPRRFRQPAWAFAAGLACAVLLFGTGLLAANTVPVFGPRPVVTQIDPEDLGVLPAGSAQSPTPGEIVQALQTLDQLQSRVNAFEQQENRRGPQPIVPAMTRQQFNEELAVLQKRMATERARDLEYLFQELTVSQARTGALIGETREALRYFAVKNDPRFSEQ